MASPPIEGDVGKIIWMLLAALGLLWVVAFVVMANALPTSGDGEREVAVQKR